MKKEMTEHARAAGAIRRELKEKFPNVRFKVRSTIFSGGDDVRISWTDGPTEREVKKIADKYQMGDFNGMIDLYEYTNDRKDIPQVKYVMCDRILSDEFMINILKKHNIEARKEELYESSHAIFDKYGAWTYRTLAWRFAERH